MNRTAASIKSLESLQGVDRDLAKRIRAVWRGDLAAVRKAYPEADQLRAQYYHPPGAREFRMAVINRLFGTYDVGFLGEHKRNREEVFYCDAGDPYTGTILFIGPRLVVGCWGDLVERNLIREPASLY